MPITILQSCAVRYRRTFPTTLITRHVYVTQRTDTISFGFGRSRVISACVVARSRWKPLSATPKSTQKHPGKRGPVRLHAPYNITTTSPELLFLIRFQTTQVTEITAWAIAASRTVRDNEYGRGGMRSIRSCRRCYCYVYIYLAGWFVVYARTRKHRRLSEQLRLLSTSYNDYMSNAISKQKPKNCDIV